MKISLVVNTDGKSKGHVIPVTLSQFVIGRDPQCNLRPASAVVSKRHCAILTRGDQVFLRDFDSTNGTFLNDQPVKGEIEIHSQDLLKVGPLVFEIRVEVSPAINRPTPPPPTKQPAQPADDEEAAALLLSLHDDTTPSKPGGDGIPEGSTIMEIMSVNPEDQKKAETPDDPKGKDDKKKKLATGNTSTAAKAILEKYMRRPRNTE
jgi:pSer/pThr/pTyr-binding forkhead associated (FHA) protein